MSVATSRERPVLFSAPMVRALLAGKKTQTRRIVKLREFGPSTTRGYDWAWRDRRGLWNEVESSRIAEFGPHGVPGDRLWVKETWRPHYEFQRTPITAIPAGTTIHYAASLSDYDREEKGPWKPSIFMRRWMSRITREVASVRVERVQDLSAEDVIAEGLTPEPHCDCDRCLGTELCLSSKLALFDDYAQLWDAINGKRARAPWASNPWVWVVGFPAVQP